MSIKTWTAVMTVKIRNLLAMYGRIPRFTARSRP